MKKKISAIIGLISALQVNTAIASDNLAQELPDFGLDQPRKADINQILNQILAEVLSTPEEAQQFNIDPKKYLELRGVKPVDINTIFFTDNTNPSNAKTGVTGCRPYTYTPDDGHMHVSPGAEVRNSSIRLSEQNIRTLEWFKRNY